MKIDLSKLAGLNWYKYGAYAVAIAATLTLTYCAGGHQARLNCEQAKTEAAQKEVVAITRYVTERVAEVQVKEVKSRKELDEIARLKRELDYALSKRPDLPECALSDSEFDATNRLLGE